MFCCKELWLHFLVFLFVNYTLNLWKEFSLNLCVSVFNLSLSLSLSLSYIFFLVSLSSRLQKNNQLVAGWSLVFNLNSTEYFKYWRCNPVKFFDTAKKKQMDHILGAITLISHEDCSFLFSTEMAVTVATPTARAEICPELESCIIEESVHFQITCWFVARSGKNV